MLRFLGSILLASSLLAGQPWGNDPGHNMVLDATNLPERLDESTMLWKVRHDARWGLPQPTIVGDKVLNGTGRGGLVDEAWQKAFGNKAGAYTCRALSNGEGLWQIVIPCAGYDLSYGVCTTPVVEENRIYILALGEILCLDLNGTADGNQGMSAEDELAFQLHVNGKRMKGSKDLNALPEKSGDILWNHSLWQYNPSFHDATACSPVVIGDQIWFSTGTRSGTERRGKDGPPHLIVLDKKTGKLIARDRMQIPYVYHGEWSSPSLVEVNGEKLVVFPDGYGFMHGLKVPTPAEDGSVVDIQTIWRIDLNPKSNRYTKDGKEICYTEDKRLWREYPKGYPTDTKRWAPLQDRKTNQLQGPVETIGMPAVVGNRVYLALGRDCYYSNTKEGKGRLMCFEITDVDAEPKLIWDNLDVYRTQCTPSVKDGLLYLADMAGYLNCFDAETGKRLWQHKLGKKVILRSQMVADGKVYIAEGKDMFVFREGREKKLISQTKLPGDPSTLEARDGIGVLAMGKYLAAYGSKDQEQAATEEVK